MCAGAQDPAFHARVIAVHGDLGRAWLDDLAAVVETQRLRWSLGPLSPYELSYHWVAAADRADGTRCVLKLSPPGAQEPVIEAQWLRRVNGQGAVRLIDSDPANGALLLERADPGAALATLVPEHDDEACDAIVAVAAAIRRPAQPAAVPMLAARVADLGAHRQAHRAGSDPLPAGLVAEAQHVATRLLATAPPAVLLHGDLHHDNILRSERRGWLAIDPHGLVGDPAYEFAAALYNPFSLGPLAASLASRRAHRMAEAACLPEERVRGWGFVQAVLSAVWSLDEDLTPDAHVLAVADALRASRRPLRR